MRQRYKFLFIYIQTGAFKKEKAPVSLYLENPQSLIHIQSNPFKTGYRQIFILSL